MSRAKNFAAAAVLVFALSLTSYGGDQQTPGCMQPPPTNTSVKSDTTEPTKDSSTDTASTLGKETIDLCIETLTTLLSVF